VTDREQIDELNTGLLLYIPYRAMEARVFKAMAAAGYDDFTPAQARVFQRIAPGGSRLTDLAEQASITKQSAGFLVDQLERAGYVERIPDPSDARARLVRITERGRQTLPLAATVVAEVETEWTEHLGKRRMGQLREILTRLREITDPYAPSARRHLTRHLRRCTSGSKMRVGPDRATHYERVQWFTARNDCCKMPLATARQGGLTAVASWRAGTV
jgi:DNA-binding MarR family transcriptional regulator